MGKKILIIDDEENFCKITKRFLEYLHLGNVYMASNGKEGLRIAKFTNIDLILLDVNMPEMNGIDFLKEIRNSEKTRGIIKGRGVPIIMITAYPKEFVLSFEIGCDDFLTKPIIDQNKFIKKIKSLLNVQ